MKELVIDAFAGGGGASTGIRMALGRDPDIALNHDRFALAMHRANHPLTFSSNARSLLVIEVPEKRDDRHEPRRYPASRKVRNPRIVQGPYAHVQGESPKAWGARPWPCFSALGAALPEKRLRARKSHGDIVMAIKPRRAGTRAPFKSFPDPFHHLHRRPRRQGKGITQYAAEEVIDLLAAMAAHFQPVAIVPGGTAFLATLPVHLIDRLAALGADLEDREPDAGEEPEGDDSDREQDAGEMPEFDPADHGVADRDALDLWTEEREALELFWDNRDRNRPILHAVAAQIKARKRRSSSSQTARGV